MASPSYHRSKDYVKYRTNYLTETVQRRETYGVSKMFVDASDDSFGGYSLE